MGDRKTELLDEVRQLVTQYRQEVPGSRKAWPRSIKERVIELVGLGVSSAETARLTGISYYTIIYWVEKMPAKFHSVRIVPAKSSATVTVAKRRGKKLLVGCRDNEVQQTVTVTVAPPSGIRIEGVTLSFLRELLPMLSEGSK